MNKRIDRRTALVMGSCAIVGGKAFAKLGNSSKKGFGISLMENLDWRDKLQQLNAKWFHTWGAEAPENIPAGAEFVPMIWGEWSCTDSVLKKLLSEKHPALLGFNEPEHTKQANMSVEKALELWPKLMETGMRLGSPGCGQPDGEWMIVFMEEAKKRGYRVDFITVHLYMGEDIEMFLKRVEKIHKLYKKPLWIAEFAVADWEASIDKPNQHSSESVYAFMEAILPVLEKLEYIERYSWFSSHNVNLPPAISLALAPSMLFNQDGSLNKLGRLYSSF